MEDSAWQREFRELFKSPQVEDWDRAFAIKKPNLPATVFKYRALSPGETRKNSLDALANEYVWAGQAKSLNDPFDCTSSFDLTGHFLEATKQAIRDGKITALPADAHGRFLACDTLPAFMERLAEFVPEEQLPGEARARLVPGVLQSLEREQDELRKAMRDVHQHLTKVCSFTTSLGSTAIWANYGDNRGYCVEYKVPEMKPNIQHMLSPVHYSDERFDMSSWMRSGKDALSKHTALHLLVALHKSSHWSYEQEWRIVMPDSPKTPGAKLQMPRARAVYLGSKIDAADREEVCTIAKAQGVPVFDMAMSERTYDMVAVPRKQT